MMALLAVCGLDCSKCEAYLATQAHDEAEKEKIAANWRVTFNAPTITVADVNCDGCLATSGVVSGYCKVCKLRGCAIEKGLTSCAYCESYETCTDLAGFIQMVPSIKATLDSLRNA